MIDDYELIIIVNDTGPVEGKAMAKEIQYINTGIYNGESL